MKLEPTKAQRKAMAEATEAWNWYSCGPERRLDMVDDMIAAANSIPEGPPVGTIARRPDGAWKAEWKAGEAGPYWQYSTSAFWQADSPDWNSEDDADSWPVIYDPTGFSELSIDLGLDWGEWGCNTLVEALSALGVKPGMNLGDIYEMVERGLHWFPPGEEPLVPRPDPTKPDAMTRLAKFEIALEEAARPDSTDHPSREELREYFHKDLAEHCQADDPDEYHEGDKPRLERLMREPSVFEADPTAQREPSVDDALDNAAADYITSLANTMARSNSEAMEAAAQQEPAYTVDAASKGMAKYWDNSIVTTTKREPRVLPSLDCEEARDGTVWEARYVLIDDQEQTPGWKFRYTADGWVHDGHRVLSPTFLTDCGPYTEVIS